MAVEIIPFRFDMLFWRWLWHEDNGCSQAREEYACTLANHLSTDEIMRFIADDDNPLFQGYALWVLYLKLGKGILHYILNLEFEHWFPDDTLDVIFSTAAPNIKRPKPCRTIIYMSPPEVRQLRLF